jgi:hypothetical protein
MYEDEIVKYAIPLVSSSSALQTPGLTAVRKKTGR